MRYVLFVLLAALTGCAANPSTECPVIIGASNYGYVGAQLIGGNNGGASLLSPDFDDLLDGRPSTLTRVQYNTSGSQTTASYFALEVFITNQGDPTPITSDVGLVALLKTSLPAGAVVEVWENVPGAGTMLANATMQLDQSGQTTSAWFVFDPVSNHGNAITLVFRNSLNLSTYLSNGTQITIGEYFISDTVELPLMRNPEFGWANSAKLRQSSAGVSWNVQQPPVRTLKVQVAPVDQNAAIDNGTDDIMTQINRVMQGNIAAFVPFDVGDPFYANATTFNDPTAFRIRSKTAMLGQFSSPPSMPMTSNVMWTASMQITESI